MKDPKRELLADQLNALLWDEDLTDEKLREASEGLLPRIADYLNGVTEWISVNDRLPDSENYYDVKFENGEEDEKPFRIRPNQNILGFMTSQTVTHWKEIK